MSTIRIIKKYANRRLYDTQSSSYITLDDLKQLVLDRIEFRVIDVQTQADITKSTLLQIISADEETTTPIFTIEVLQHLIRSYGNNVQNLLGQYLEQAMSFFIQQQETYKMRQQEYSTHSLNWMSEWLTLQQKFWQGLNHSMTTDHAMQQPDHIHKTDTTLNSKNFAEKKFWSKSDPKDGLPDVNRKNSVGTEFCRNTTRKKKKAT